MADTLNSAADPASPEAKGDVIFVYDGECPLCRNAAAAFRIRAAVGLLQLVDARAERHHPVVQEINRLGLDLDEGMVIQVGGTCYHGADALHIMALLGTGQGWLNRLNALMFRSPRMARLLYPAMRGTRNLLVRLRGAGAIDNLGRRG
jgi:predicted DCC family thiol-disulfide oxidoreductase YuxK